MIIEIIGWIGMALIVGDFVALSHNYIGNGLLYQLVNIAGSSALLIQLVPNKVWPAVGLQIVWILIALSALWSML